MQKVLEYTMPCSAAQLYQKLVHFDEFGAAHPYMKKVNLLQKINEKESRYEVFEEVTVFGFIKMKPHYEVLVIAAQTDKKVQYKSLIQNRIQLLIDFELEEISNTSTRLKETVTLKGPFFILGYFMSVLKAAHEKTFAQMTF